MIKRVEVCLDDNVPECMAGVIRCGSVISFNEKEESINHQELVDNTEYYSEYELIEGVSKKLNIHKDIIEIVG